MKLARLKAKRSKFEIFLSLNVCYGPTKLAIQFLAVKECEKDIVRKQSNSSFLLFNLLDSIYSALRHVKVAFLRHPVYQPLTTQFIRYSKPDSFT